MPSPLSKKFTPTMIVLAVALVLLVPTVSAQVYNTTNLRAHFTLDTQKTNGTQTFGQFGLNGSIRNGVLTNQSDCALFTCYRFDGTNDDIQITNLTPFTVGNQLTISAWFNRSVSGAGSDRIVSSVGGIGQVIWEMSVTAAPERLECRMRDSLATNLVVTGTANSVIEGNKHFGTCVFNSTGIALYLDGRLNATGSTTYLGNFNPADFVYIGDDDGNAANFEGMIDDVKFFNQSLSAARVLEEYNNGSGLAYNTAPTAPTLTTPANGSLIHANESSLLFNWTASTDTENDSLSYQFFIDDILRNTTTTRGIFFNASTLANGNHTWYVKVTDTFFTVQSSTFFFDLDNTLPNITITYPTHPLNWGNGTISGSCVDQHAGTISTSSTNGTLGGSFGNWTFTHISAPQPNNETITFTCTDSFGNNRSDTRLYLFDYNAPGCLGIDPMVPIDESSSYVWNLTCIDDSNYFSLNVSCDGGTEFTFYQDNINSTMFTFNDQTGELHSNMHCTFVSSDAHTDEDVTDLLNPFTVIVSTDGVSVNGKELITVVTSDEIPEHIKEAPVVAPDLADAILLGPVEEPQEGTKEASTDYAYTDAAARYTNDRVSFTFATNAATDMNRYVFYVNAEHSIDPIVNSQHHAWFVVDHYYWVDFDLAADDGSATWSTYKVNKTTWAVVIDTPLSELAFSSVGIINQNTQEQDFIVRPAEQISELFVGQCPVSINGSMILWLVVAVAFVFLFLMFYTAWGIFGIFSGITFFVSAWTLSGCSRLFGTVMALAGIIVIIIAAILYRGSGRSNDTFA